MQEIHLSESELREYLQTHEPHLFFSKQVANQTERILRMNHTDQAPKRRLVDGITVDGPTTLDADDAIWVEKSSKGHRVFITITDISEVIPIYSPIDMEAMLRGTSLYLETGVIPMLPGEISNERYSLNGKRRHIALTVEFDVDHRGKISNPKIYESLLHHRGKYTHDNFHEILESKHHPAHAQVRELKEVARKINTHRGFDLGSEGMSEVTSSSPVIQDGSNVHRVIEVLMVTANQIVAQSLENDDISIFRQHNHPEERAFYSPNIGMHAGLRIYRGGYTHFTSPLRRYIDLMIHRIVKAKLRKEPLFYSKGTIATIVEYVNRRILEVDILEEYWQHERRGRISADKVRNRHGRDPGAHDFKAQLRNAVSDMRDIASIPRTCIVNDIQNPDSRTWQWAVGFILLGKDMVLKQVLRKRIIEERAMTSLSFLNSLAQTRIVLGGPMVFQFDESVNAQKVTASLVLPDGTVLRVSKKHKDREKIYNIRSETRRALVKKLFEYYEV